MRAIGIVAATFLWLLCWLIAPASWWFNAKILDEQAFRSSMQQVLQIEEVDTQITDRATAQVMDNARDFVQRTVPLLAGQADFLLERAQPTVSGLVNKAVNSQPGEKVMLGLATQVHNAFLAWLEEDTLGRPGFQADLDDGQARFDVDELLTGQTLALGPVDIPLDALDLPGIGVPVPLPPDWMRTPLQLLRSALLPAVIGIAIAAGALVWLDRGRLRALGIASGVTALVVGGTALILQSTWSLSGADSVDWTITRAIGELLVRPWITAYVWVVVGMVVIAVSALAWDRYRMVAMQARA